MSVVESIAAILQFPADGAFQIRSACSPASTTNRSTSGNSEPEIFCSTCNNPALRNTGESEAEATVALASIRSQRHLMPSASSCT